MDLRALRLFLFDLDGTLYLGETLFPFTKELLATLRKTGRDYLFMTNNSSKSVADYVKSSAGWGSRRRSRILSPPPRRPWNISGLPARGRRFTSAAPPPYKRSWRRGAFK